MNAFPRCDGVLRRDILRVGGLSALGLGLPGFFRVQRANAATTESSIKSNAKACILIWLDGGPSHLETFDPKPHAPAEVRGPLRTVPTQLAGIHISECLPQTATCLDKVTLIRSMTSPLGEHNFGTHYLMTGYKPTPVLEYPAFGSVVAQTRKPQDILPANIAVPNFRVGGSNLTGHGYLAPEWRPFSVGSDPARADFQVRDLDLYKGLDLRRLDRRRDFVAALDRFGGLAEKYSTADPDLERAFRLIASAKAKQAFQLDAESDRTRSRYGRKTIGQSCLLARRLVERGVPFVTVNDRGWDTHENLYTRLKEGYAGAPVGVGLIPSLDLALSALIEDLENRGMLQETLIVVMGEFGRTPKLHTAGGRDHWPRAVSVLLAGGGGPGGQVIGATDAVGESPADRPVTPGDLAATIYKLLGVDPATELVTNDGRPVRVTDHRSRVIQEIVG